MGSVTSDDTPDTGLYHPSPILGCPPLLYGLGTTSVKMARREGSDLTRTMSIGNELRAHRKMVVNPGSIRGS